MEKKSIEEIKELIDKFEGTCGESFVDCFIDDNINNIGFLVGYIYGKFPDLGKVLLANSNWRIVWKFVQDCYYKDGEEVESIAGIVENYYNEDHDKENLFWATVIYDNDPYYDRFEDWLKERNYLLNDKNHVSTSN